MVPAYCLVIEAGSLSPVKLAMIGALRGKQRVVAARRVVLPAPSPLPSGPQGAPQAAPGGAR